MRQPVEPSLGDIDSIGSSVVDRPSILPGPSDHHGRKPWLALLLGIVCAPAAFAYVGRFAWCVWLTVFLVAVVAILSWSGLLQSFIGVWIVIALGLLQTFASILLPWWLARAQQRSFRRRWYNRWYWYPVLIALAWVPVLLLFGNREQIFGYATYRIPSSSMAPTIGVGDFVVADMRAASVASLRIGDVVINESIARPGELNIRRIVAMGGQHVSIDESGVHVDGVLQAHIHQQGNDMMDRKWMNYPDVELERDQFYLMGDNRGNSFDSRSEGPFARDQIRGKATAIWWSNDMNRLGAIATP